MPKQVLVVIRDGAPSIYAESGVHVAVLDMDHIPPEDERVPLHDSFLPLLNAAGESWPVLDVGGRLTDVDKVVEVSKQTPESASAFARLSEVFQAATRIVKDPAFPAEVGAELREKVDGMWGFVESVLTKPAAGEKPAVQEPYIEGHREECGTEVKIPLVGPRLTTVGPGYVLASPGSRPQAVVEALKAINDGKYEGSVIGSDGATYHYRLRDSRLNP